MSRKMPAWFLIFMLVCSMTYANRELYDVENRQEWGIEPNTIRNPGFENIGPDNKPTHWTSRLVCTPDLTKMQKNFGFNQEVPVWNSGFEEVDASQEFFRYARIRKIGRIKYHKDVWKRGLNLKDYRSAGKLSVREIYPGVEEETVHQGTKALKFEVENSRGFSWSEVYLNEVFEVKPFTQYLVSFWYCYQGDPGLYGTVWLHLAGKKYVKVSDFDRPSSGQWKQHVFYFKTGQEAGKSALQFWGTCEKEGISGKVVFDEIRIFTSVSPWDTNCWKVSTADAHTGTYCLQVGQTARPLHIIGDMIGVDYHKRYKLSVFVKAENVTGENFIRINWQRYANKYDLERIASTTSPGIAGTFDWKQLEIPLVPPETAQFLEVELFSSGNQGIWLVDDFFLDGFGDEDIEFLMCQAGFEKNGYKDVIIRTKAKFPKPPQVELYRKDNARPVLKKFMEYRGKCKWGRHYYQVEFSKHTEEGEYFLKVKYGKGGECTSPVFPIRKGRYRQLAKDAVKYFYYQRSGYEIPGWHKACFLDDAWFTSFDTRERYSHVDLTGGWFDAADLNKWLDPQGWYVRAICRTYQGLRDERKDFLKGQLPDIIEEARWGADYIRKSYRGDGNFYFCVKGFDFRTPPDEDTDNIPGNDDDRCSNLLAPESCATMGLASMALALKKIGSKDALIYLQTSADAFAYQTRVPDLTNKIKKETFHKDKIRLCLAALDLYQATGQEKYLAFAKEHVRDIAEACLKEKELFAVLSSQTASEEVRLLYFLEPLEIFAINFPEEKEADLCRQALKRVAEHMALVSRLSPLQHTQTLTENPDDSRIFLSAGRSTTYLLSCAAHLAAISGILGRPDLLDIAERDLQYALGRNFHGASCMAKVGWKWGAHFTFLCNFPGREEGIIPYAVNKGHGLGQEMFRTGMPYAVMPGVCSPLAMEEWNLEVYGVTQSFLLNALTNITLARERAKPGQTLSP